MSQPPTTDPTLTPPATQPPKKKDSAGSFFKELPVLILIAFGLALIIKTFLVQAFYIPSASMEPTLHGCAPCINEPAADRVLVNKLVYRFREPRRGEIVVFAGERAEEEQSFGRRVRNFLVEGLGVPGDERDFIKRVVALPGETIQIRKGRVTITPVKGKRFVLDEPYLAEETDEDSFGPFKVPPGSYFMMGDNRPNSADSRTRLGPIAKGDIVGKAFVRIWPIKRFDFFHRPTYQRDPTAAPRKSGVRAA